MICPICHFNKSSRLLNLNCGNIDGSILYPTAKITACRKCGHIFNILSPKEISNLKKYYDEESAPVNIGSPDKVGDKTGNMSPFTLMRYNQLYKLISPYTKKNDRVLDCGCATGGFLEYLSRKGFDKLAGFEISATYRDQAAKWKEKIKVGDMDLSIPFPDSSADFLVADQVIEHLSKPRQAFKEARRVLGNGGFFCISVPDALRYSKNYFFDFYWFLLREHICHFDIEHLKLLAALEGFELVTFARYDTPMMTEKMILPILTAIFRSTSEDKKDKIKTNQKHFLLKRQTIKYIKRDLKKLKNKKGIFERLAKSKLSMYAWGIGREFMYIYESAGLKKCNIAGLIDANPYKQQNYSVGGRKIESKFILDKATKDSALVISAIAHTKPIKNELRKMGYKGQVVNFK